MGKDVFTCFPFINICFITNSLCKEFELNNENKYVR